MARYRYAGRGQVPSPSVFRIFSEAVCAVDKTTLTVARRLFAEPSMLIKHRQQSRTNARGLRRRQRRAHLGRVVERAAVFPVVQVLNSPTAVWISTFRRKAARRSLPNRQRHRPTKRYIRSRQVQKLSCAAAVRYSLSPAMARWNACECRLGTPGMATPPEIDALVGRIAGHVGYPAIASTETYPGTAIPPRRKDDQNRRSALSIRLRPVFDPLARYPVN